MRKKFKIKHRSCGLCHPNKIGWQHRWTASEEQLIDEFDAARRDALRRRNWRSLLEGLKVFHTAPMTACVFGDHKSRYFTHVAY